MALIVAVPVLGLLLRTALALRRIPRRSVPRLPSWTDRDERTLSRRLTPRRWETACRAAGIAIADRSDPATVHLRTPVVVGVEPVALGLRLTVMTVRGQSPEDMEKQLPNLASALAVPLRFEAAGALTVTVTAVVRDAVAGIRAASLSVSPAVVVGRLDDGRDAVLDFQSASHVAIQGMTRSGKSAFCYTALGQVAQSPLVRIGGVDPNRVLLAPIARASGDPNRFALGDDIEGAVTVLDYYLALMAERMEQIDADRIDKINQFSAETPIEVVVLEEYDGLLALAEDHDKATGAKPADRLSPRIQRAVRSLVAQGAKAGIRVVLITQRMDASIVGGATRGQFGTRVTFGVDDTTAVRMLHPALSDQLTAAVTGANLPPGRAVFWVNRAESMMQADLTEYAEFRTRVGDVEGVRS